jgi:hypothetical protein
MSAGHARLKHAMKTLNEHWDFTKDYWADQNALDFEKNHLIPVQGQVESALRGIEKLSEVLQKIRADCS